MVFNATVNNISDNLYNRQILHVLTPSVYFILVLMFRTRRCTYINIGHYTHFVHCKQGYIEWTSSCCSSSEQCFSHIMTRTRYSRWYDDDVHYPHDQLAEFYSASSHNMALHSDTLSWFRANQSLLFLLWLRT
jgi:hypothetical protein